MATHPILSGTDAQRAKTGLAALSAGAASLSAASAGLSAEVRRLEAEVESAAAKLDATKAAAAHALDTARKTWAKRRAESRKALEAEAKRAADQLAKARALHRKAQMDLE